MNTKTTLIVFFGVFILVVVLVVIVPFLFTRSTPQPEYPRPDGQIPLSTSAGIFRSDDAGKTWSAKVAIGSGPATLAGITINQLVLDPRDPHTLYLATQGNGIFVSFDRGESWGRVRDQAGVFAASADALKLAVNPHNPQEWFVAVYQGNRGRVLRTTTAGDSFAEIYFVPLERFGVFDLAFIPAAATVGIVTGQGGYLETANGGRTWRVVRWFADGLTSLVVDPTNPAVRFTGTRGGNIFKTSSSGASWVDISPNIQAFSGATRNQRLVADHEGALYLASDYGLVRSRDGGLTFHSLPIIIPAESLPILVAAVDPKNVKHIIIAASTELYESWDDGATWSILHSTRSKRITAVAFDYQNPQILYAVVEP